MPLTGDSTVEGQSLTIWVSVSVRWGSQTHRAGLLGDGHVSATPAAAHACNPSYLGG
jgi:hypothetical protein